MERGNIRLKHGDLDGALDDFEMIVSWVELFLLNTYVGGKPILNIGDFLLAGPLWSPLEALGESSKRIEYRSSGPKVEIYSKKIFLIFFAFLKF